MNVKVQFILQPIYAPFNVLKTLSRLRECRTLWGECEQTLHYSIDCYVAKAFTSEVSDHSIFGTPYTSHLPACVIMPVEVQSIVRAETFDGI